MNKRNLVYIFSVIGVEIVGFIGTFFTTPSINGWYVTLLKPSFNPPNWIFGPVWTFLFLLIGLSLAKVLLSPKDNLNRSKALMAYVIQLTLNVGWSFVFFYLHKPGLAVGEIIILIIAIATNIYYASKVKRSAAILLVPYLLWVSFATILNIAIWQLNR